MVNPELLYNKIIAMPSEVAEEVNDFVDFIIKRKQTSTTEHEQTGKLPDLEALPKTGFGCMKGMFKMAPDFDEPLEDFKDYM